MQKIYNIPNPVWSLIFQNLDWKSFIECTMVCQHFKKVIYALENYKLLLLLKDRVVSIAKREHPLLFWEDRHVNLTNRGGMHCVFSRRALHKKIQWVLFKMGDFEKRLKIVLGKSLLFNKENLLDNNAIIMGSTPVFEKNANHDCVVYLDMEEIYDNIKMGLIIQKDNNFFYKNSQLSTLVKAPTVHNFSNKMDIAFIKNSGPFAIYYSLLIPDEDTLKQINVYLDFEKLYSGLTAFLNPKNVTSLLGEYKEIEIHKAVTFYSWRNN